MNEFKKREQCVVNLHQLKQDLNEKVNAKQKKELCTLMKLQNQQLQWQSQQIPTTTSPSPVP